MRSDTASGLFSAISAVSTPPGKGGVAVIRISGEGAAEIAGQVFFPKSRKKLTDYPLRTQVYGEFFCGGRRIDDGMATYFAAPHSFTGEDTVEFCCHGGILVTGQILEAVFAAGARSAEAGEFTRRAFLNGKITLPQAEAIGDLLEARSKSQVFLAAGKGKDRLTEAFARIRSGLTGLLASLFARIDYPDEDLGELSGEETLAALHKIKEEVARLLATYPTGRAIGTGIRTVIAGKPNVGKSTLYNALLGRDAAIVTDIPGTTRDVLTADIPLGDVMLLLADTAGMREKTGDPIETIGVGRTKEKLRQAELIFALFDPSRPTDEEDREAMAFFSGCSGEKVAVITKSDLPVHPGFDRAAIEHAFPALLTLNAKNEPEQAKDQIARTVSALFTDEKIRIGEDAILSSARQNAALSRAAEHLDAAIEAFSSGIAEDAAASEIERALGAIGELDGKAVSEEVVSAIFSHFCVGK